MSKRIIALLIVLLLGGCASKDDTAELDRIILKAVNANVVDREENNCTKAYYTYNTDLTIGRQGGDEISNQFLIDGNQAALSLDISSILMSQITENSEGYELRDIGTLEGITYQKQSTFINSSSQMIPFKINICKCEDGDYFVLIQTSQFVFIANVSTGTLQNTVYDMIVLLRTCVVDDTKVIYEYASDSVISYQASVITLFSDVVPESGSIEEYLNKWKQTDSFVKIDQGESEKENSEEEGGE